jgi:signal transduction histidine kinase
MNTEVMYERVVTSVLARWLAWSLVSAAGVSFVLLMLQRLVGWPSPWGRAGVITVGLVIAGLIAGLLSGSDYVIQRLLPAAVEATALMVVFGIAYLLIVGGTAPLSSAAARRVAWRFLLATGLLTLAYLPVRTRLHRALMRRATPRRQTSDAWQGLRDRLFWASTLQELSADARDLVRASVKVSEVEIWLRSPPGTSDPSLYAPSGGQKRLRLTVDEQGILARAAVSGTAWLRVWLPHLTEMQRDTRVRVAPIAHADELLGFVIARPAGRRLGVSDDQALAEIAHQLGLAVHNLELATALRTSRDWAVSAADMERRRIERDLHDGAQQQLVALAVNLGLVRKRAADDPTSVNASLEVLHGDLQAAIAQLRDLAHGIYPPLLRDRGLPEALAAATRRTGMGVDLSLDELRSRYPAQVEAAVYFCCLEALQNAAKHGGDSVRSSLRVWEADGNLAFEVVDDGPGFDLDAQPLGDGLRNMRERIGAVGGTLVVESQVGAGTRVRGRLPLSP